MSFPSRFDNKTLLSGVAGGWFNNECLRPDCNQFQCDIRLVDDKRPLLDGTKCILLLGEKAHRLYTGLSTTLDENRGSPVIVNGIPCISSFSPQDCVDFKNYEKTHNEHYETEEEYFSDEMAIGEILTSKGRGKTARANYRFWLIQDTKKILRILKNDGKLPPEPIREPEYIIKPPAADIIKILQETKNDELHLDIETDPITQDVRCIGFMFRGKPEKCFVFQTFDTNYLPAYANLPDILVSLAVAMRDNLLVCHNGSLFDFVVLALKFRLSIRRVYDTMVAQHRIFPDIEKSLGHCVSYYTYLPYHKNTGNHNYRTSEEVSQLMLYCGKDVYTMLLVKIAQEKLMEADPGLKASIDMANDAIRPYIITTLTGIKYDDEKRRAWVRENERLMKQYLDMIQYLIGPDMKPLISNKACIAYFHTALGYKVVKRSKITGNPSLAEDALLKLKLNNPNNIVIDLLIQFRRRQKENGTLLFKPWIPGPNVLH